MFKKIIITISVLISMFQLNAQFLNNREIPIPEVIVEIVPDELKPGESFTIFATYNIPEDYHMFLNEDLFTINIGEHPDLIFSTTQYPLDETELLLGLPAFSGSVTISKEVSVSSDTNEPVIDLKISAAYQICEDDGTCLLPDSVDFIRNVTVYGDSVIKNSSPELFTILWYILLAFAGGVLLNIMPCVLPLLSVKALNLIEQSKHDKKTILKSSLLYGAGILISFLSLALIVIILKSSGELFGWGFQFQNPLFVLFLLTIVFIFSLSLFDVFTINPPQTGMNQAGKYSAGKSYGSSFLTGIFAVLIATPCTAPFMGAALGFAFSQPPGIVLLIFTFLSLGFALPFILLGLYPSFIQKIPRPGNWMNLFKEFMGFLLLGTVVYLLTSLHSLIGSSIKGVLWFLLFTGLSTWIYGRFGSVIEKRSRRISIMVISIIIISASAFFLIDLDEKEIIFEESQTAWKEFSSELVQTLRSENKAVFIDFYADWCTSCKINDATVLNTNKMMNLFNEYDVQLLKGNFTAGDREIAKWLNDYERAGVPLYILFRPGEDAVVFPEILTRNMIERELIKIRP